jgi:LTXXQ motif family protein
VHHVLVNTSIRARGVGGGNSARHYRFSNPLFAGRAIPRKRRLNSPVALEMLAQASSQAMTRPVTAEKAESASSDRIETNIKELHNKLHITVAQDSQWNDLAQVMRDNAKAMVDRRQQQAADTSSMDAGDGVKSYGAVIEAHEAGMKKFIPAFETLYNSMSDEQKKSADSMFRNHKRATAKKESSRKEG